MKTVSKKQVLVILLFIGALCPMIFAPDVFAGEGLSAGRKIYNNVMSFLNFGILVFLFIKFAKNPMMKYFRGVRAKVAEEFDTIHGQKENSQALKDAEAEKIRDIETYLAEIKNSIIEMGEREKEKIIEEGRFMAEKIIKDAQNYTEYRIDMARRSLTHEMVDLAFTMVEGKLSEVVTEEDRVRFVDRFVTDLEGTHVEVK